jgi:hypothetical protein
MNDDGMWPFWAQVAVGLAIFVIALCAVVVVLLLLVSPGT